MVADIERYPEFLPWCRAARILERGENEMLAELIISFNQLTERYTSRVELHPQSEGGAASIEVTMTKGPFEHLVNRWRFMPLPSGGTQIDFYLDFKFRSRILEKLLGAVFSKATEKMVTAFKQRADVLYGQSVNSLPP
jgi:coenzyme Q-binding protein COQ10